MAKDAASLQASATRLITSLGRPATLRTIDGSASDIPVTVAFANRGTREGEGGLSLYDERQAIVAAGPGVAPDEERHHLVVDARLYRLVNVRALQPGLTTLYFDCMTREVTA